MPCTYLLQIYECCCCVDEPLPPTEYNVICLGITNSGKTTLLAALLHENFDTIIPTIGENLFVIQNIFLVF